MHMEFTTQDKGRYTEVAATGRLNMVAAPKLREVVNDVVSAGGKRIVVNLAAAQPQVTMVLELTSMHRVLTPHPTPEDAFSDE
jgi:anti-sigma B factor antagonist